ncbi:MAG: biotin/lipoyl-containing protein [Candidatus Phytoplasma stylosanthis]|nr:biotin/lipoyl-containing protein [Candidatus Phytoplasma stylosanthis]MDV3167818.1 biotin/lipoyl-containing protein [Candidatus Phytoplasma stylosanthis]MDV3170905.1 biotin/lipoyl-containing protein [Candidatus Phytoplasma stylosanthis]MDV3173583.1 biotin/lipoyl-containing protein [Candidatus Phytoplasma stylosanthis]MDV3174085.1 biotin/lipoyl-containing protein [Candidatus Phytoplasma stylosanthis]MDV3202403.1 biotin/lipoyl-containing protein [Candidatus Phytoplasma stylosanthis]
MVELRFSDIGEGINEGKIITFFYKEGDFVKEGENLLEVETDKVSVPISSPKTGKIKKIFFNEGDQIEVGDLILTIE